MAPPNLFSTYTKDELFKKLKKLKKVLRILIVVLVTIILFAISTTTKTGISFYTFIPAFFAPIVFILLYEVKKVETVHASRSYDE
jgi:uncharacterized membrane protein YoaK (UPF0700 family)